MSRPHAHPFVRRLAATLAAVLLAAPALAPAPALASAVVARVAGDDRYATSAEVSRRAFSSARTVVVATGEEWADALSASALAGSVDGPLLLTRRSGMTRDVLAEVSRLGATRAYIVGGAGRVPESDARALREKGVTVRRLAGSDRYRTAALVAEEVRLIRGSLPDSRAILVSGKDFADALTAGPIAARQGWPVLLTQPASLPPATAEALRTLGVRRTLVVGGLSAVSAPVAARLPAPTRVCGPDRYATAVAVARWAAASIPGWPAGTTAVASGRSFPDALGAAGLLDSAGGGSLLLAPYALGASAEGYLASRAGSVRRVTLLGGEMRVSRGARMKAEDLLGAATYSEKHLAAQALLDGHIAAHPIVYGSTIEIGPTPGEYQAVCYYAAGRIVVSPAHTAPLSDIVAHEVAHIIDWRTDGDIDHSDL